MQETCIAVAKTMPEFRYEPKKYSFKSWLRLLAEKKIADQFCKRLRGLAHSKTLRDSHAASKCPPGLGLWQSSAALGGDLRSPSSRTHSRALAPLKKRQKLGISYGNVRARGGYLSLQDQEGGAWFRQLRWRRLD